jgi:hypothetical protein
MVIFPVCWPVLTNRLRSAILFKLPPGDLDACTIWFDTTCSVKKYVGNTVIVLVVLYFLVFELFKYKSSFFVRLQCWSLVTVLKYSLL